MKPHIWMFFVVPQKVWLLRFFFLCEEIATVRVTRRVPRWKIWMWKLRWSTVPSAPTRQEHKFVAQRLLKDGSDQHPSCNWHRCSWLVGRAKWHLYRTNLLKPGVAWKKWPKQATVVAMTPAAEDCPTGEDVWSDYWESCALDRGPFSISKHHQSFPEIICMWLKRLNLYQTKHPQSIEHLARTVEWAALSSCLTRWTACHLDADVDGETACGGLLSTCLGGCQGLKSGTLVL